MTFKAVFVSLFLLTTYLSSAQPTITNENIPKPGLEYVFLEALKTGITIDTSGPEMTWDFSDLTITEDTVRKGYLISTGIFPQDPLLDPVLYSNFNFSTSDSVQLLNLDSNSYSLAYDYYHYYAYGPGSITGYFHKDKIILPIPFSYMDEEQDEFTFFTLREYRNLMADAWGILIF